MRRILTAVALATMITSTASAQSDLDLHAAYCLGALRETTKLAQQSGIARADVVASLDDQGNRAYRYLLARGYLSPSNSEALSRIMIPIAQGRADEDANWHQETAQSRCSQRCSDVFEQDHRSDRFNSCMGRCLALATPLERKIAACVNIGDRLPF